MDKEQTPSRAAGVRPEPRAPGQLQPSPATARGEIRRLARFQTKMFGLLIGGASLLILLLVLLYFYGGFGLRMASPSAGRRHRSQPVESDPALLETGKEVHVEMGAAGDMIRWRFVAEDEDDRIQQLLTGPDGVACVMTWSEKYGHRVDTITPAGVLSALFNGNTVDYEYDLRYVLGVGAGGVMYFEGHDYDTEPTTWGLCAVDRQGQRLWLTALPQPFKGELSVGADGTLFAIGTFEHWNEDPIAHSCLCALNPQGAILWTYHHEGGLRWPLPLPDDGVLVYSRPHYDRYTPAGEEQPPLSLLRLSTSGQPLWSYEVGLVEERGASASGSRVCVAGRAAGGVNSCWLALLDLETGRELWRYDSGPLAAPPLLRPDGVVIYQTGTNVLVALSPKLEPLWTHELWNKLGAAPLVDADNAIYFVGDGGLACLDADGNERYVIPVGSTAISNTPIWGPEGMIYLPTNREVLAFQPE
jgi:outer membrane protein assembly factor BamB